MVVIFFSYHFNKILTLLLNLQLLFKHFRKFSKFTVPELFCFAKIRPDIKILWCGVIF